jgi:hypothetical protein
MTFSTLLLLSACLPLLTRMPRNLGAWLDRQEVFDPEVGMESVLKMPKKQRGHSMIWLYGLATIAALSLLGWLGLKVQPAPFPSYSAATTPIKTMSLPVNLPTPVERFYRKLYGDKIPIVTTAVITGRASIRPVRFLPAFPARYRFTHEVGQNYRHYIEATWFGFPILRVNETYLDGKSRQEMPWGTLDNAPKANQAANLGMWAETMSMPSVYLTDPRVRWEPVDDQTALLVVPFGEAQEKFVVRFDPSGVIRLMTAMRYREAGEQAQKILWLAETLPGRSINVNGTTLNAVGSATWLDQGKPWAFFASQEIVYNVDVSEYVRAKGL